MILRGRRLSRKKLESSLVAITCADRNLVTSFSATTAEDSGACLGLHTAEKAVRLGSAAAVGLKGTLRHGTNSSGAGVVLPDLLVVAATSDSTLLSRIFLENEGKRSRWRMTSEESAGRDHASSFEKNFQRGRKGLLDVAFSVRRNVAAIFCPCCWKRLLR
jgi:hypothetical protein